MLVYMVPYRRSSSYSFVSTRNIHHERDLYDSSKKKLAVTAKSEVIAKKRSPPSRSTSEKITAGKTVSLVLWLSTVVVSATEEGYLTIVYKGDFQLPEATVRVTRKETKKMTPVAVSPALASTASSAPATANNTFAAAARPSGNNAALAPRPTTAGKSVVVLKRIYPEAF
uniref:Uncharacterized protein n=1 Tax=Oryza punctata TaxID=4537 RepID=A0A0E0KGF1_ORYPU